MSEMLSHRRHKSTFTKGMTLEEYLRGMEVQEDTIPTADTRHPADSEECLYRTSHQFYNPDAKHRAGGMKEILQENFEDSLDGYRESINIVSNHLQTKKLPSYNQELTKAYRVRHNSPYSCGKPNSQFSPYKTFIKKLTAHPECPSPPTLHTTRLKQGKKFEIRRSTKCIKEDLVSESPHYKKGIQVPNEGFSCQDKVDVRVQTLKERLQQKKRSQKRG